MKQNNNENAANRYSYVGNNYSLGENDFKNAILNSLPENGLNFIKMDISIFMIWMLMVRLTIALLLI